MDWNFCENHEYSEYFSGTFNRLVCYTCDPEGENNKHRPSAQEAVAKAMAAKEKFWSEALGRFVTVPED